MKKNVLLVILLIIFIFSFRIRSVAQYNYNDGQGFTMMLELGGLAATNIDTLETFRLSMINGYQFSPHFMLGAGIGMDMIERGKTMFPLFVDIRGILGTGQLKGMAYADFGYGIVSGFNNRSFGGLGIGGLLYLNEKYSFSCSLGYEAHHVLDQVLPQDDVSYSQIKIGLKMG